MISFDDPAFAERVDGLGFQPEDLADLHALVVSLTPAEFAAVERAAARLVARIDHPSPPAERFWPDPAPEITGRPDGLVPMVAFAVTAAEVAARHADLGVPTEVSLATLADLGEQVRVHRRTFGAFGLHTQEWLTTVWSGRLFALGRLQFELIPDLRHADDSVLSVHIPESGPLTPEAVDDALDQARRFFPRHFPDRRVVGFHCLSWLLDPELAARLPGTNLAAFQQRWQLTEDRRPGDLDTTFFVFHRRGEVDVEELPTRTRLERATVDLLRAGRSWTLREGYLPW